MTKEGRSVRLSQTLAPFGVGAIYDLQGESLIACDTFSWRGKGAGVSCKRLAESLGVAGFRSAPSHVSIFGSASTGSGVPYFRFPQWLFCQVCRQMVKWTTKMEVEAEPPKCGSCAKRPQLVPMRFVMACEAGHLGDVSWEFWVHFGATEPSQKQCRSKNLKFVAKGGDSAGLDTLLIECRTCGAKRTLSGITSKETVKTMALKCPGKQPWQYLAPDVTRCTKAPVILQRGASNLYFSTIRSAIDIPPESAYDPFADLTLEVLNHDLFAVLRSAPTGPMATFAVQTIAESLSCTEAQVLLIADQEARAIAGARAAPAATEDLETDEWRAFITPQSEDEDERGSFITRHTTLLEKSGELDDSKVYQALAALIDRVVVATKLREVRALTGFTRYDVAGVIVPPDLGKGIDWLPAIEVFGEGVFFSLHEETVAAWEARPDVIHAVDAIEARRRTHFIGSRLKPAVPRFVLLHTLSHMLIRQLSFQCGYSSASLRERIYAAPSSSGEPQAGILIYTAAGDVEGTLGGLVRQGEPPHLAATILAALERGAWCSSDPICRENPGQGFGALNLAACHACALVSETSCENANVMLDRRLVVGLNGIVPGLFEDVVSAARLGSARYSEDDQVPGYE
jgi:hypothetical protein